VHELSGPVEQAVVCAAWDGDALVLEAAHLVVVCSGAHVIMAAAARPPMPCRTTLPLQCRLTLVLQPHDRPATNTGLRLGAYNQRLLKQITPASTIHINTFPSIQD
jgi:hypothetical protein